MARRSGDPEAQRAALALLVRGEAVPAELAELAGVSRQLVAAWARSASVRWQDSRQAALAKAWRKELDRGTRLEQRSQKANAAVGGKDRVRRGRRKRHR